MRLSPCAALGLLTLAACGMPNDEFVPPANRAAEQAMQLMNETARLDEFAAKWPGLCSRDWGALPACFVVYRNTRRPTLEEEQYPGFDAHDIVPTWHVLGAVRIDFPKTCTIRLDAPSDPALGSVRIDGVAHSFLPGTDGVGVSFSLISPQEDWRSAAVAACAALARQARGA